MLETIKSIDKNFEQISKSKRKTNWLLVAILIAFMVTPFII